MVIHLDDKFSSDLSDTPELEEKKCFKIYFGVPVSEVVVSAVKVVALTLFLTIKSPK